jgi:DNA polymerase (family 10)
MDKREVARMLEEIGTLLELKGENAFKTRAYHNAARLVQALDADLEQLVREERLTEIKGIGAALAEKIAELVTTGRLGYYDKLQEEFPPGFMEILRVPGLGPKKARALFEELKIGSLDELEAAARADRLSGLAGFGDRTQEKILEGIAAVRRHAGRFHVHVAEAAAAPIVAALRELPAARNLSVAGSLRRRGETVKDIDIVVATGDPEPVMEAFVGLPGVASITGRGETKSSVRLESGLAADLRCVTPAEYPFALMYFTGSKAHNVALRGRAQKLGLRLNEYGLFAEAGGEEAKSAACRDEAAIYRKLGLAFVEPELREDTGEIEAAEAGRLPELIAEADIRGLLHQHTNWSDGSSTLEEMIEAAVALGLEYFGITDHSRSAQYARGLTPDRVRQQHEAIDALQATLKGRITLFKGIESDILADGSLDYDEKTLASFDYVVASVHSHFNLAEAEQTARIVKALAHPKVRILGHPTGRLLLERDPYPVKLGEVLAAAAAHDVAVEINASPWRLDLDWREMRAARDRGCRFSINPDAHDTAGLADTRFGVGVARKGWLAAGDVINTWSLARIRKYLHRR